MDKRVKHGMYGTRIYRIWSCMKNRCNNPKYKEFNLYGGRGITYCNDWEEFEPFHEWADANGYEDNLTIDRIDSNGNYEPSNCRWITDQAQAFNRRSNIIINYHGLTKPLKQWAYDLNLNYSMLYKRYQMGWDAERMFVTPSRGMR